MTFLLALLAMACISYAVLCLLRGVAHGRHWAPIYRDGQPVRFWWHILLFGLVFPAALAFALVKALGR